MKYVLVALLTLSPSFAHAGFRCQSVKHGPDHGTTVIEREDGTADVIAQSIMGPRKIATLGCHATEEDGEYPNTPHAIVVCKQIEKVKQPIIFQVTAGGVVGIQGSLYRYNNFAPAQAFTCTL